jgi:hypothetical protein
MKKKTKEVFTGAFKAFGEEIRIDHTLSDSRSKCRSLINGYKARMKKRGVTKLPKISVKKMVVR